ncbi:hypothetical protein DFJ73DRAFT_761333 [Zopfochytrium polystomum]|nr:hypothetical protein DFJ73DRAFT_761333 [Zopfochytrium polystomum]
MASTTTVASKTATLASRSGEVPYHPEGMKLYTNTVERFGVLSTPFKSTITDYLQTAFDEVPDLTPMAISPLPVKTPTTGAQVPTFARGLAGTYGSANTQHTANPVATPTDPKPTSHTTPVFTNVASEKRFKLFFPSDEEDSPLHAKNPGVRFTVDSTLSAEETPAATRKAPAAHKINPRSTDDRHPDTVTSCGLLASTQPAVATRLLKPEQQPTSTVPHNTTAPPPLPPKQERTEDSGSDGDDSESDNTRPPNSPPGGDPFNADPFSDPNEDRALQPGSAGEDFLQHAARFPPQPERRDQWVAWALSILKIPPTAKTPGSQFQFRLPP